MRGRRDQRNCHRHHWSWVAMLEWLARMSKQCLDSCVKEMNVLMEEELLEHGAVKYASAYYNYYTVLEPTKKVLLSSLWDVADTTGLQSALLLPYDPMHIFITHIFITQPPCSHAADCSGKNGCISHGPHCWQLHLVERRWWYSRMPFKVKPCPCTILIMNLITGGRQTHLLIAWSMRARRLFMPFDTYIDLYWPHLGFLEWSDNFCPCHNPSSSLVMNMLRNHAKISGVA